MTRTIEPPLSIYLTHVFSWPEVRRGGERYLHELAGALAHAGHDVRIVSTAPLPAAGRQLGVPVTWLRRRHVLRRRFGGLSSELAFGFQSLWTTGRRHPDVWHALGTADAWAAGVCSRLGLGRSVFTNLGLPLKSFRDGLPDRRLHESVVEHVDEYVCLSRRAQDLLRSDYGREGRLVGGGVDMERFQPRVGRHGAPALLFSGSLDEPRKNARLLLEAALLLRGEFPSIEVWLSGPGDPENALRGLPPEAREIVRHLGTGRVEDQEERYGSAWATVLPSTNEAFGLALLESLACGTPIVALRDGGGPTDLTREGSGFLADEEAGSLADACRHALDASARDETVEACRAVAWEFDWKTSIVPQLERCYRGKGGSAAL